MDPNASGLTAFVALAAPYVQILVTGVLVPTAFAWIMNKLGLQSQSKAVMAVESLASQGAAAALGHCVSVFNTSDFATHNTLPVALDKALSFVTLAGGGLISASGYTPDKLQDLIIGKLAAVDPNLVMPPDPVVAAPAPATIPAAPAAG